VLRVELVESFLEVDDEGSVHSDQQVQRQAGASVNGTRITIYTRSRSCAVVDFARGGSRQFESLAEALDWIGPRIESLTVIYA